MCVCVFESGREGQRVRGLPQTAHTRRADASFFGHGRGTRASRPLLSVGPALHAGPDLSKLTCAWRWGAVGTGEGSADVLFLVRKGSEKKKRLQPPPSTNPLSLPPSHTQPSSSTAPPSTSSRTVLPAPLRALLDAAPPVAISATRALGPVAATAAGAARSAATSVAANVVPIARAALPEAAASAQRRPRSPRRSPSPPRSPPRAAAPPLPTRQTRRLRLERARAPPPPPPIDHGHPVLALVRERAAAGSKPGARSDGAHLALVVEGGGMRGAVSGGALQALHDLGLRDAFDVVYGSSAGAMNATYFLAGQRDGVNIYSDHIANDRFCDMRRLLRKRKGGYGGVDGSRGYRSMDGGGGDGVAAAAAAAALASTSSSDAADPPPALDLDYLIDYVMSEVIPLDWDAVVQSDVPLKVVASCVDSLAPVVLDAFTDAADLAACLRASAQVPEVAGGPVHHRGRRLVDAAVFEPVPFRAAINDGATHVLTLCTRPPPSGRVARIVGGVVERVVKRAVMSPDYMKPVWRREVELVSSFGLGDFDMLQLGLDRHAAAARPEFGGAHLYPAFPGAGAAYAPVCTDVPTIRGGIAEGRAAVERLFSADALAEAATQARAEAEGGEAPA